MIYGYCRVSTKTQSIERQERNIKGAYPDAFILKESFTGTTIDRPEWNKLMKIVRPGDTIVFDSVSRMSRSAEEGTRTYFELLEQKKITLVFLKEHYIDTDTYLSSRQDKIALTGTDEDEIFKGLNNYFRKLAERQIRIAFEQSEKEVNDLHQRTKEGILSARLNGKQIGKPLGSHKPTKKELTIKRIMYKKLKCFNGRLNDKDFMAMKHESGITVAKNTFYKYKREMLEAIEQGLPPYPETETSEPPQSGV